MLAVCSALLLAGCTGHSTGDDLPKDYGQDWLAEMSTQLAGDSGGGGGRLTVDDENEKRAQAVIGLQYEFAGPYDVLAVCRSTKTVHLAIHDFTNEHGDSLGTDSLIGGADIHCGATTRIPIEVPKGRDGIELDATTTDTSGRALFDAFVVARGSGR